MAFGPWKGKNISLKMPSPFKGVNMNCIEVVDLGFMPFPEALQIQERYFLEVSDGRRRDTLILVEHPPVLTLGRRGKRENIIADQETLERNNAKIYEISRGGDVTYHGPGQIVGYPIMNLANYGKDIRRFVGSLENVFIKLLKNEYNIGALPGENKYTGVWVGDKKITAIGIAVKKWVTMHGFAFNVNTRLADFGWIVPCGLTDCQVTSIENLTGQRADFEKIKDLVTQYFLEEFNV